MNLQKILKNSKLKTHQEFQLIKDKDTLSKASKEQLIELYLLALKHLMIKDNLIAEIMKELS